MSAVIARIALRHIAGALIAKDSSMPGLATPSRPIRMCLCSLASALEL